MTTAFTDTPPEGFANWSTKTRHLVRHAVMEAKVSMSDVHLYGAYACISKGQITPDRDAILAAFMQIPDDVVAELESYINRVTEREEAAQVEVEDEPGKP